MLAQAEILFIAASIGYPNPPEDLIAALVTGCARYKQQAHDYLGHPPFKDEAEEKVEWILLRASEIVSKVPANSLRPGWWRVICSEFPYPFDNWFC